MRRVLGAIKVVKWAAEVVETGAAGLVKLCDVAIRIIERWWT